MGHQGNKTRKSTSSLTHPSCSSLAPSSSTRNCSDSQQFGHPAEILSAYSDTTACKLLHIALSTSASPENGEFPSASRTIRERCPFFGSVGRISHRIITRCFGQITVIRISSRATHEIREAPFTPKKPTGLYSAGDGVSVGV